MYLLYYLNGDAIWEYNHDTKMWRWVKGMHNAFSDNYYVAEGIDHELNEAAEVHPGGQLWQMGDTVYMYQCKDKKNIMWRYVTSKNQWNALHISYDTVKKYIAKGVASIHNTPGMKFGYSATVIGRKLFMYGGYSSATIISTVVNELWQFDLDKNMWTLMKGEGGKLEPVYGTKGISAPGNTPQGLARPPMWSHSNKIYLLGNVLWEYDQVSNNWRWLKGDTLHRDTAVYGIKGIASAGNQPGFTRSAAHCSLNGKLYLAGGWEMKFNDDRYYPTYQFENSNVVWEYDPATNNWTWLAGHNINPVASYGTKGVPASTTTPGPLLAPRMVPLNGKLYLYGGTNYSISDDIWSFDPSTNLWTWVDGTKQQDVWGKYKKIGQYDTANRSGGHSYHKMWSYGTRLYVYGGYTFPSNTSGNSNTIISNAIWSYETCKDLSVCYVNSPTVELDSPVAICDKAITLNAGNTGCTFLWNTNDTTQNITVRAPGKYWVTVINPAGKQGSDTTMVVSGNAPVLVFSDTVICDSDRILISARQPSAAQYRWNTADTSAEIYGYRGTYRVQVIGSNGCYSIDSVSIGTTPSPVRPRLGYNGPLCTGTQMNIKDSTGVVRNRGGLYGPLGFTGVTSQDYSLNNISLADAGAYYMVDTLDDCAVADTLYVRIDSVYTPTVSISVNPGTQTGPYVPLTFTANVNYQPDSSQLQWYKNGILLPGETGKEYKAITQTDLAANDIVCVGLGVNLNCVLTDTAADCAQPIVIDLSVDDLKRKDGVLIVPNPVKDKLHIHHLNPGSDIQLRDYTGRLVYTIENTNSDEEIDMTALPIGNYIVEIIEGSKNVTVINVTKL